MAPLKIKRSIHEGVFLLFFVPAIIAFYLVYKYPMLFVDQENIKATFFFFGKNPSFWYSLAYSSIVCIIAGRILLVGTSPYQKGKKKKPLSSYQKKKWFSILLSQSLFFFVFPYILPWILHGGNFWDDPYTPLNKDAYVYVYNGFTSPGGFFYIFILVPLLVWFFGKRYCSWFCACGNLAEAIGVTPWGRRWVTEHTPRGPVAKRFEVIQTVFLVLALAFGIILFLDEWKMHPSEMWRLSGAPSRTSWST